MVVGIGASAGGLGALREFFANVPDGSGLAYVVVVHLSPEHDSHLAGLLQPHSRMSVLQVADTVELKPDCVYVIPPAANLSAIDTHLRVTPMEERRVERAPIDHFLHTLADQHRGHAIGVILTGTGSDGTLGVKEIKLHGGLTVAQDPIEAEYDGMPQSAIATGFIDLVLPVASIPGAVLRFANTAPRLPAVGESEELPPDRRVQFQKVMAQVKARTGRDFARYKRSTVMRRIQRRMQLRSIEELEDYLAVLRQTPDEVRALADDLLITVTSFFRDPQVFARIERDIVPKLFQDTTPGDRIRIWCVGCATGEEVYSIAMLLREEAERRAGDVPKLQIFASDLHERSLEIARDGFYPGDIASEVSSQRLKRFFTEETGGYRVRKELREMVVFTPHNLLADPPFSRLDLVVCRNLMIYLQRDVQADVLRVFHYALKPGGILVLGTSETADDGELFRAIDKQHSIHRRGLTELPEPRLPIFPITPRDYLPPDRTGARNDVRQYLALHEMLVRHFAFPSALIGPDGQLLHLSENAGRFLAHPGGRVTTRASRLVRKELATEFVSAVHLARRERRAVHTRPIEMKVDGDGRRVVLHIHPSMDPDTEGYGLVVFEELEPARALARTAGGNGHGETGRIAQLTSELTAARERLQNIIEEFDTGQEEMRASNEELQSANEELRSTMEELETSKEELQSMNEELHTVNQENRHKVAELAQLSGDLQNLLTATDIATLFLDRELRIQRFTPKVGDLFNMRATDRGRSVFDLTHRLGYPELREDSQEVLRRLGEIEREVKDADGRWYLTRLLPYRSRDDRIEGVVITFVDITRRKQSEEEIQRLSLTLEERVADQTRQVRHLTASLVRVEQRERRRLSETLHDELQQLLFSVQLRLRLAREACAGGRAAEQEQHFQQAEDLLSRSTRVTRALGIDLNPPILRNEGIRAILGWLRSHMRELHGLEVHVQAEQEVLVDDSDTRVLLFQMLRELLFNIAKHSGTSKARVAMQAVDGALQVVVSDEGRGFEASALASDPEKATSLGLTHVRERLKLLGGKMSFESAPGAGTRATLTVPLAARIGDA